MKLNRFAVTLYLAYPTIGSLVSIFMIGHFVIWAEGRINEAHPYSDALIYVGMALNEIAMFGDTHITWRFLIPWLAGIFGGFFNLETMESVGLLIGTFNYMFLLLAFGLLLRFTFHNVDINAVTISLPAWCIIFLPAFWRGAFLPMMDTAVFLIYALVLIALFYRKYWALCLVLFIGIWIKEMILLSVLLVPAFQYARDEYELKSYLPFVAAGLIYILAVTTLGTTSGNYLFNPGAWTSDWAANLSGFSFGGLRYIISGFGLGIIFIIWRMKTVPGQRIHYAALAVLMVTFLIFLMFTPSNSPRLLFMAMPVLFLFNHTDASLSKYSETLIFQTSDDDKTWPQASEV